MSNLRILYVANEIDPFLDKSSLSEKSLEISKLIRNLARNVRSQEAEVRVLVPKFGVVNDRKNRLHEVVRLSGINVKVYNEDKPLVIKVASIREERIQVYFIDNSQYFKRKSIFKDKTGKFHVDNNDRIIFFSKGILETMKYLKWSPNIIHCSDWVSSLVPLYLKTIYKNEFVFKDTKCIFTHYNNVLPMGLLTKEIMHKEPLLDKEPLVDSNGNIDYRKMISLGAKYSDMLTVSCNKNDLHSIDLSGLKYEFIPTDCMDNFVLEYEKKYQELLPSPASV